jgi:glycosyltransferase involved in cell wall biosynthesis
MISHSKDLADSAGPLRSALCIANVFPPAAASGTHRTRAIVRYLPSFGWRPVVVTLRTDPTDPYAGYDPALLEHLPHDLAVYRTQKPRLFAWLGELASQVNARIRRAPPTPGAEVSSDRRNSQTDYRGITGLIRCLSRFPDGAIGWFPAGVSTACWAAVRHRCRAIYSSAPHWTSHLIGLSTKRLTGRLWVADFRDPWRANPFRKIPYRVVDRFDAWLERSVVTTADWVVCNTAPLRDDFANRYPALAGKFITIPNGFDPEDYNGLAERRIVGPEKIVLTHAGWFYGRRRPEPIFRALALLDRHGPPANRVVLQLVGDPTYEGKPLSEIAIQCGVADKVHVVGEVPHRAAMEYAKGSDLQLLVGFGGPGSELQVPAKLFEYFGVGKPLLALAPPQGAIIEMIEQSRFPAEVCDPDDPEAISTAIARLVARHIETAPTANAANGSLAQFYRRAQVERLANLFEAVG